MICQGELMNKNGDKNEANLFKTFQYICSNIEETKSHSGKTAIITKFISSDNLDKRLFFKLLLPKYNPRKYNLNVKQLIKIFSELFCVKQERITRDYHAIGDVSHILSSFYPMTQESDVKGHLTIHQVEKLLDELSKLSKYEEQYKFFENFQGQLCTRNDLKFFIRLIMKDLRINAGLKVVLSAISPRAYDTFLHSSDIDKLFDDIGGIVPFTPIRPMLAESCKTLDKVMKKFEKIFAEVKYDGERVQIHKFDNKIVAFSRNMKLIDGFKLDHIREFIPESFPNYNLIIDAEILLFDLDTKKPLPFGTLGVHKKTLFKNATICLYVFDIMYLDNEDTCNMVYKDRRSKLEEIMIQIPNYVLLSEKFSVDDIFQLEELVEKTRREGLEGLIIKNSNGTYEPGKRHWIKIKKDYLGREMADTADLVVLGAYYGTGNNGGLKSVFLMGSFDTFLNKWCTVTKVGNGFTDAKLKSLQDELEMDTFDKSNIPEWINIKPGVYPDFIIRDPWKSQVWEIIGAEFSTSTTHTANMNGDTGTSIRFPRLCRVRDDKSVVDATNCSEINYLMTR